MCTFGRQIDGVATFKEKSMLLSDKSFSEFVYFPMSATHQLLAFREGILGGGGYFGDISRQQYLEQSNKIAVGYLQVQYYTTISC